MHRPQSLGAFARLFLLSLGLALPFTSPAAAAAPDALIPALEPLRPLLGKTWRGEFKNSTPEKPMIDIARWERALNGRAVRVLHSVNRGEYGGETLITWDPEKKAVVYHYFTTAGFNTIGTMTFDGRRTISLEKVRGEAGGIAEVRSTAELRADGTMTTKAEFLRNGAWEPGHEINYREDPKAEVVFR